MPVYLLMYYVTVCDFCLLKLCAPEIDGIRSLRGHQLPVTCVAMTPDDRFAFSGDKDGSIIKCMYIL